MHVIRYQRCREFGQTHSACRSSLDDWFEIAIGANWSHLIEVQSVFPLVEAVGNFTVFNLQGNRNRLIVSIDYKGRLINIKCILSYVDYDRGQWKHDLYV